jgi:hypothetical protein
MGLPPPDPRSSTEFVEPPSRKKNSWVRHWRQCLTQLITEQNANVLIAKYNVTLSTAIQLLTVYQRLFEHVMLKIVHVTRKATKA